MNDCHNISCDGNQVSSHYVSAAIGILQGYRSPSSVSTSNLPTVVIVVVLSRRTKYYNYVRIGNLLLVVGFDEL
jgi:hypothetical protein